MNKCSQCGIDLKQFFVKEQRVDALKTNMTINAEREAQPAQVQKIEVSKVCPMCGEYLVYTVEKGSKVQIKCKSCKNTFTFWH
jgi:transposase-like protein